MTEEEARAWLSAHADVPRETMLERYVALLIDESSRQNLISSASIASIRARHIVDSAQLVDLARDQTGHWIDIGSGAGLPGMVVAIMTDRPVTLIEPRRKRADFLDNVVTELGLKGRVRVVTAKAEQHVAQAMVISARAVAPLPRLFAAAAHLSTKNTLWLLPKGRSAAEEVAEASRTWHGSFHVEHSITDPQSLIVTAKGVARR